MKTERIVMRMAVTPKGFVVDFDESTSSLLNKYPASAEIIESACKLITSELESMAEMKVKEMMSKDPMAKILVELLKNAAKKSDEQAATRDHACKECGKCK